MLNIVIFNKFQSKVECMFKGLCTVLLALFMGRIFLIATKFYKTCVHIYITLLVK